MQPKISQPASLYSISLNKAISFVKNHQLEAKKIYLPEIILSDIYFTDLFERSISRTSEGQILSRKHKNSFKDLVASSEFKNLLVSSASQTKIPHMMTSCAMKCCTTVAQIAFAKGPAALADKHNLVNHKKITDAQEYINTSAARIALYLFVQNLYTYINTTTIELAIRKRVSLIFINTFNNLEENLKIFTRSCNLLASFLEVITKIPTENLGIQPIIYISCVKNFIELAISKETTILKENKNLTFLCKLKEHKEALNNGKITPAIFIDICFQAPIKDKLLAINNAFS